MLVNEAKSPADIPLSFNFFISVSVFILHQPVRVTSFHQNEKDSLLAVFPFWWTIGGSNP